ncbi:MAG: ATP-dependent helicase HrpB [Prochlorococcus sp.]
MGAFPIDALLPQLSEALSLGATVLLQAPPGAGKTTRVPLALLGEIKGHQPLSGRILMLEPRRLAAKAAATRLANNLNEPIGQRVGFSVRHEQRRSKDTQLEVITDGLFLRRLQNDPALEGVDCVIFDEFHERRRDADIALALLREARTFLNPELRLLLMSATLNLLDLQDRLPEATLLKSDGKAFPVTTNHQPARPGETLPLQVRRAIEDHALPLIETTLTADAPTKALRASDSQPAAPKPTVLVFLPGLREIERTQELLATSAVIKDWELACLHGQQPLEKQAHALNRAQAPWQGKIVLASSIAESSLTLEGVLLVIDSGLSRQSRFDANTGMEGLITVPSSWSSANQRRGRAGRQAPGHCVRLWSPAEQQRRPDHDSPELLRADPQPVVLELAAWGAGLGDQLPWLDPPSQASLKKGQQQLINLNVLDQEGKLKSSGRQLAKLGVHPRLGILLLQAQAWGCATLGADLAALLSERDLLNNKDFGCDLGTRLQVLRQKQPGKQQAPRKRLEQIRQLSRQLLRQLKAIQENHQDINQPEQQLPEDALAAQLVAMAFPEWLALERPEQPGNYLLRQGRGAILHQHDPISGAAALAVARVDLGQANTLIQLALPLSMNWVEALGQSDGEWSDVVRWDERTSRIQAERLCKLGELLIKKQRLPKPKPEICRDLLLEALRNQGLGPLPWGQQSSQLRQRLELAHQHLGRPWPARDIKHLTNEPENWLGNFLLGCLSWDELKEVELLEALWGDLSWDMRQKLDLLLPEKLQVPSGREAKIIYNDGEATLSIKLQEMFGCDKGPSILAGTLPVTIELLSPAGRALQRTKDLASFWRGSYQDVRRDMRGRYPKHPWPANPIEAIATAKTKQRNGEKNPGKG